MNTRPASNTQPHSFEATKRHFSKAKIRTKRGIGRHFRPSNTSANAIDTTTGCDLWCIPTDNAANAWNKASREDSRNETESNG